MTTTDAMEDAIRDRKLNLMRIGGRTVGERRDGARVIEVFNPYTGKCIGTAVTFGNSRAGCYMFLHKNKFLPLSLLFLSCFYNITHIPLLYSCNKATINN